jgi:hypothetical protein
MFDANLNSIFMCIPNQHFERQKSSPINSRRRLFWPSFHHHRHAHFTHFANLNASTMVFNSMEE